MKKLTTLLLSSVLLIGVAACDNNAKTSTDSNNTTEQATQVPETENVQNTQQDSTNDLRQRQANADIRAREQRNNVTGGDTERADGDLESEVRSKLEVNITKGQLTVDAKDGVVTVAGTVPNQTDLAKIDPLTKEIKGVKSVINKATVAPAQPKADNQ